LLVLLVVVAVVCIVASVVILVYSSSSSLFCIPLVPLRFFFLWLLLCFLWTWDATHQQTTPA